MIPYDERLPKDLINDFRRNRDGRLSTRQWLELITEPLVSLLLLSVPMALLLGRFGLAGRLLVLALVIGFLLTLALRAIRFARVRLCYRELYAVQLQPRWKFWRKTTFAGRTGDAVRFNHKIAGKLRVKPDESLHAYYVTLGGRNILVSMIPQAHPKADLAEPSADFERRGGILYAD